MWSSASSALGGTWNWPIYMELVQMDLDQIPLKVGQYKNLKSVPTDVIANGGVTGFYRGFTPTMLRAFPTNAVCFFFFELTMNFLK